MKRGVHLERRVILFIKSAGTREDDSLKSISLSDKTILPNSFVFYVSQKERMPHNSAAYRGFTLFAALVYFAFDFFFLMTTAIMMTAANSAAAPHEPPITAGRNWLL